MTSGDDTLRAMFGTIWQQFDKAGRGYFAHFAIWPMIARRLNAAYVRPGVKAADGGPVASTRGGGTFPQVTYCRTRVR